MRIVGAFHDMRKVLRGSLWIVQITQRHPAGGEVGVDPVYSAHRRCRFAGDIVGSLRIVLVEQFAHQQTPLEPPLV
jgi:hypothetical protein